MPKPVNDEGRTPSMADNPADPLKKKRDTKPDEKAGGSGLAKTMDKGPEGRSFATGNSVTDYGKRQPKE